MSSLLQQALQGLDAVPFTDGVAAPAYFDAGIPFDADGSVSVDDGGAIDHYHQGLSFTAAGRLVVDLSAAAIDHHGQGGAPFTSGSRLLAAATAVSRVESGTPYTSTGAVRYS